MLYNLCLPATLLVDHLGCKSNDSDGGDTIMTKAIIDKDVNKEESLVLEIYRLMHPEMKRKVLDLSARLPTCENQQQLEVYAKILLLLPEI